MPLGAWLRQARCVVGGHRFVVWVRAWTPEAARHPHLGTWCRCARCGQERDWLPESLSMDDVVLDRVSGIRKPLRDVLETARSAGR